MSQDGMAPTGALEQQSQLRFGATQPVPIQAKPYTAQAVAPVAGGSGVAGKAQVGPVDLSLGEANIPSMMGGFMEFADKYMAPKFAEQKKAAMYQGMLRQQAGESIDQMRKEQNPILTMFGQEGGLVQGAKIGASVSGTAQAFADIQADMPRLAQLTSADASKEMQKRFSDAYAGMEDDSVRALAAPQFFETHSALMVQHGKASVLYQKNKAVQTTITAGVDAGTAIQALAPGVKDGTVNSEVRDRAVDSFLEQVDAKPDDVSDAEWQGPTLGVAKGLLDNGNFEAFTAFKKSKSWAGLDQDQRDKLMLAEEGAHQRQATYNPAYKKGVVDRGNVEFALTQGATSFRSDDEVLAWMDMQNADNQKQFGTTALVYTNDDRARLLNQYRAGLSRKAAADDIEAGAARDYEADRAIFYAAISTHGDTSTSTLTAEKMNGFSNAFYTDILNEKDPTRQQAQLTNFVGAIAANPAFVPDLLRNPLTRDLSALRNGAPITPSMGASFAKAKLILSQPNGPAALDAILGGELSLAYKGLAAMGVDFNDPVAMEKATINMRAVGGTRATADDVAAAKTNLESAMGSLWWDNSSLSQRGITTRGKRVLLDAVAPIAARYRAQNPGLEDSEINNAALADVVAGGDLVNGVYVPFNIATIKPVRMQDEVAKLMGVPNVNTEQYVDAQGRAANAQLRLQFRKQAGSRGDNPDEASFNPNDYEMYAGQSLGGGLVRAKYRKRDIVGLDAPDYEYTIVLQPRDVVENLKIVRREWDEAKAKKRAANADPFASVRTKPIK